MNARRNSIRRFFPTAVGLVAACAPALLATSAVMALMDDEATGPAARTQRVAALDADRITPRVVMAELAPVESSNHPVRVIYNDRNPRAGGPAAQTGAEAFVYKNDYDSGFALFVNYLPNTGLIFPGTMTADEMILGNGFVPGVHQISAYEIKIWRSYLDPTLGQTAATYHFELWDGDPLCAIDVPGAGYACAKIPGTEATWSNIDPPAGEHWIAILRADLPVPAAVPHQRVWGVLYAEDTCRTGWSISSRVPEIGDILKEGDPPFGTDIFELQSDYDASVTGDGTCCDGRPGPCMWSDLDQRCPGESEFQSRGFCTDLDAESAAMSYFGGPCVGGVADFCASFYANVFAPTDTTFSWVPKASSDPGAVISGNEITLTSGGHQVWLEIEVANWDPDHDGDPVIYAWQACLDESGLTSGLSGALTPWSPVCTSDADCEALVGNGSVCDDPSYPGRCLPSFRDPARESVLPADPPMIEPICPYGGVAMTTTPAVDPGTPQYGGSLAVDVSSDAGGTFQVGFVAVDTWMKDAGNVPIPMIGHVPAQITIETGRCCFFDDRTCRDDLTGAECTALGGGAFVPDGSCAEPCPFGRCCDINDMAFCRDDVPEDECYGLGGNMFTLGETCPCLFGWICCYLDGGCELDSPVIPEPCDWWGPAIRFGPDLTCLGDNNGDGVDDACLLDAHVTLPGQEMTTAYFGVEEIPPIPSGFFGPGSDAFSGAINLEGEPIDWVMWGTSSAVVGRTGYPIAPSDPVGTTGSVGVKLMGLQLGSVEPITVTYNGGQSPEAWHVSMIASVTETVPMGELTALKTHANGGTFSMTLPVRPLFEFISVSEPSESRYYAPELTFVLSTVADAPWVHELNVDLRILAPSDGTFVPGVSEDAPGSQSIVPIFFAADASTPALHAVTAAPNCRAVDPPEQAPGEAGYEKNRYLSFVPSNGEQEVAYRVTLVDMPPPFDDLNGEVRWVGQPWDACESGDLSCPPQLTFDAATLECNAYVTDWSAIEALHVYGDAIVPGATYEVQAIAAACDPGNEDWFSAPHTITTSLWGDVVLDCSATPPCGPPDGDVNFDDVASVVDKFRNLPGAPIKARADLAPDVPDQTVDFVDIPSVVDAFRGLAYPFDGPSGCR